MFTYLKIGSFHRKVYFKVTDNSLPLNLIQTIQPAFQATPLVILAKCF